MKLLCFLLILTLSYTITQGQSLFRLECDFSIKEKLESGKLSLVIGKVYYDLNHQKLVYNFTFPEKETWVIFEQKLYKFKNGQQSVLPTMEMNVFTIFHLALTGNLFHFGLNNSSYKIAKVENDKGKVITTYTPQGKLKNKLGNIKLLQENKNLAGVVMLDQKEKVLSKLQFSEYIIKGGLALPGKVIQTFENGSNKVTTHKNLKINDMNNEKMYNYPLR